MTLFAGVELGGTKSIAVLARDEAIIDRLQVPTTTPKATLTALADRLAAWHAETSLAAIGIASFGPLVLDPRASDYGRIAATPKPHWSHVDVRSAFADRVDVPVGFDTDVGGAALAEGRWGAARGATDFIYLTIGTGVGAGIVAGGKLVHGTGHPEVGHLRVRRAAGDSFAGACPFHGDCLEGLVCGPALQVRTGLRGAAIPPDHPVWTAVAADIAEAVSALVLTLAPQRILVGGGVVSKRPLLLATIARRTAVILGGYLRDYDLAALQRLITAPDLGDDAGPLGAVALAMLACETPAAP